MLKLLAKTKKLTTFLILALALNVIIPPTAQPESYPPLTEQDVLPGQDGSTNDEKEEGNTTPGNDVSPCSDYGGGSDPKRK